MAADSPEAVELRRQFAGVLAGPEESPWREAFRQVPRHCFVPSYYRQDRPGGIWEQVAEGDVGYFDGVYSDVALATQLDANGIPTSSSSEPSTMLAMLDALDPQPGESVFELGTGTGYNTALLSHRIGARNITSVDVDRGLVESASARLDTHFAFRPRLLVGDGMDGDAKAAPFQRVIATIGLPRVPRALLGQSTPGAVHVLPLGTGLLRLVAGPAGDGHGSFLALPARFMSVRDAGRVTPGLAELEAVRPDAETGDLRDLSRMEFPVSLALPGLASCSWRGDDGETDAVGMWMSDGSAATVHRDGKVRQLGARRIWDTVRRISGVFGSSEIRRADFSLVVDGEGQHVLWGGQGEPVFSLPQ